MKGSLYSIGIDLGTTNSAIAYNRLTDDRAVSEIFLPVQWETFSAVAEAPTLPSFLYLPTEAEARHAGLTEDDARWIIGRLARNQSAETPGRVAHSAKSWLGHHAVDRSAAFLPWGSDVLAENEKISPIEASALILSTLKAAWDQKFEATGPQGRFDAQEITITVPASFDAAAQKLTLEAAAMAGYPKSVRLLEEPQAAFYRWLESQGEGHAFRDQLQLGDEGKHVLVVDVGGGTSDFSLFRVQLNERKSEPVIERLAVSDHLLLGGDNIDLGLAYIVQARFEAKGHAISGSQWPFLLARCRDLKERVLAEEGDPEERFTISVPGRGSSLLQSTLTETVTRQVVLDLLLDGFFPDCDADAEPERSQVALKEWGLPYASDYAVTRYLAEFLRDRPRIDAILFNGGTLYPRVLQGRLRQLLARWQGGHEPITLQNDEPDLAVARGAARFGWLSGRKQTQIQAGAARAIYLEVQRPEGEPKEAREQRSVVCVLPRGTEPDETVAISLDGLRLRLNQPVRFQAYYSAKRGRDKPGEIVKLNKGGFHALPPLQTVARWPDRTKEPADGFVPVRLQARVNAVGLLQIECQSALEGVDARWPLDFNLRAVTVGAADVSEEKSGVLEGDSGVPAEVLHEGKRRLKRPFLGTSRDARGSAKTKGKKAAAPKEKVTPARVFAALEETFGMPKHEWNGMVVRDLWPALEEVAEGRRLSIEHEETWLSLAGFLLRPGYGAALDEMRIDELWQVFRTGLAFPNKRVKLQEYILWRRLAGGLDRERQERLLAAEWERLEQSSNPPAELVRLAGALERLPQETKRQLIDLFLPRAAERAGSGGYAEPYFVALTLLLNRAPLYAGPETVVPPDLVEAAYERLGQFDWSEDKNRELCQLFLRAARVVDNPYLDLPKALRKQIAAKLEKAGVAPGKVVPVREFTPLEKSDHAGLLGESMPPGIVLG